LGVAAKRILTEAEVKGKKKKKVMPENENLWWRAFFVCLWKINSLSLELENFIGERFMSCITGR